MTEPAAERTTNEEAEISPKPQMNSTTDSNIEVSVPRFEEQWLNCLLRGTVSAYEREADISAWLRSRAFSCWDCDVSVGLGVPNYCANALPSRMEQVGVDAVGTPVAVNSSPRRPRYW
jgi:hypothetical protein